MGRKFGAFSRCRPRMLTLVVLFVTGAPIVLANFTSDLVGEPPDVVGQYGWPLIWHWHTLFVSPGPTGILDWGYSANRLIGNVMIWLIILATPAGACEWLLRRYRPQPRWSLRAMLVAVALVAAFLGWFLSVRNRADFQDSIISEAEEAYRTVFVEHPGPRWLEFVVPDRYRRHIIGMEMQMFGSDEELDEKSIERLARLPRLQHVMVKVSHRTPAMAADLAKMRRLRSLRIDEGSLDEDRGAATHEFVRTIGTLPELERLSLEDMVLTREDLACLAGLTKLESLWLDGYNEDLDLLAHLPVLPRLEAIDFGNTHLTNRALQHLALFPRLRAINLSDMRLMDPDADLVALASLPALDELAIDTKLLSAARPKSFGELKRLKTLHIGHAWDDSSDRLATIALAHGELRVLERELPGVRRALQALRRANPAITIDTDTQFMLSNNVLIPRGLVEAKLRSSWRPWYVDWFPASFHPHTLPVR